MTDLSILRRESFEKFIGKSLGVGHEEIEIIYTQEEMPFLSKVAKISISYKVIVPVDNNEFILIDERATVKSIDGRGSKSNMGDIVNHIKDHIMSLAEEYPEQSINFTEDEQIKSFIGKRLFVGVDQEFKALYAVFEEKHFDNLIEEEAVENIPTPISNSNELFISTITRYPGNDIDLDKFFVFEGRIYKNNQFSSIDLIQTEEKGLFKDSTTNIILIGEDIFYSVGTVIVDPEEIQEFQFQKGYQDKWSDEPCDDGKVILFNQSLYCIVDSYKYLSSENSLIVLKGEKNSYYRPVKNRNCKVIEASIEKLFRTNIGVYSDSNVETIGDDYYVATIDDEKFVLKEVSYYSLNKQSNNYRYIGEIVPFNGTLYVVIGKLENMRFSLKRTACLVFAEKYNEHDIAFRSFEDFEVFYKERINPRRALYKDKYKELYFEDFTNRFEALKNPVSVGDTVYLKEEPTQGSEIKSLKGKIIKISNNQEIVTVCYFNYFEVETPITNVIKL